MPSANFYDILGVSKDASESEIKKAFRALSLEHHPDRNHDKDTTEEFQRIGEAYETLSNPEKRQQYDMQQNGFGGMPGMPGMGGEFHDINQIFNMMFGGGFPGMHPGMHPGMQGGPDIRIFHGGMPGGFPGMHPFQQQMQKPPPIIKNVIISMEQSYTGCSISLEFEKWIVVNNDQRTTSRETMSINIPPGVDDGETVILQNRGNVINDACKGDVKIILKVENTTEFQRTGMDLVYKRKISLKEALCGFNFTMTHVSGKTLCLNNNSNITIIKPDYKKVIPGLGMQRNGQSGNLIIDFSIEFPDFLTPEQMEKLGEIL
jgi:DnaJ homolog subfamily A member 2